MRDIPTFDEQIARSIRESERSGELKSAKDWGKPLDFGDGYDETPPELRMAFKILKDGGFVPPEVEMLRELQSKRGRLAQLSIESTEAQRLREEISELQLKVTVRIEQLQRDGI
ncbi:DUF1992 domain-containing protein [Ramlibacter sp. MMS24-I3-19]|uniref:DnaJ family domain-containing protein n=1 Tax=Ramlibacter sp. MMS24-I3-19 TaxID=3416606 RepID=UPI003CFE025C